ncbi:MAG: plasmid mobilization protein [Gaiellaceae bacterium]
MSRKPGRLRSEVIFLRVAPDEKAVIEQAAGRAKLDVSSYVRRCVAEAIDLERAVERADQEAGRRAERLGRLSPTRIEELRRRGGDWSTWPELDEPEASA